MTVPTLWDLDFATVPLTAQLMHCGGFASVSQPRLSHLHTLPTTGLLSVPTPMRKSVVGTCVYANSHTNAVHWT